MSTPSWPRVLRVVYWHLRRAWATRRARRASHRIEGARLARSISFGRWIR